MIRRLMAVFAMASLSTAAIAEQRPDAVRSETITLSLGQCFGRCPVYELSVSPSEEIGFVGRSFTRFVGERSEVAPPGTYAAVERSLREWRPATGTSAFSNCDMRLAATDHSSIQVEWSAPDGARTVLRHYLGCLSDEDRRLTRAMLDITTKLEAWDLVGRL